MANDLDLLSQEANPYNELPFEYQPGKKEREVRRIIWNRYRAMYSDILRKEQEKDWEHADVAFRQWVPPTDPDDWRADIMLPDAFAAIQTQSQETIDRKSRPQLKKIGGSDENIEVYANAIMNYNMDRTSFDYQFFLAKQAAAVRGTAFLWDYWRHDERMIEDPTDVDAEGNITYQRKMQIDYDDDYTQWIENEFVYIDPAAHSMDDCADAVIREIWHIDEFRRVYHERKDFINIDMVQAGGDTSSKGFFRQEKDFTTYDVEVLHYYNRSNDQYFAMANNVVIRDGCIPNKHKEIPLTAIYQYRNPGRFWGIGIPKVIWALTEERRSIRNLNLDRQKMQINKMFLVNDQFDIDEDEAVVRPHGFINVNTNGAPLSNVIMPLEYGDVPSSADRVDQNLMEDIRRAHGIDDRMEGVNMGGTATEAAILKESAIKRINMVAELNEMDSLIRLGRIKWSNIQFFYPTPRLERIFENNEEIEKKVYRKIRVEGKQFVIDTDPDTGGKELQVNDIEGSTSFELNKSWAYFMQGDFDVVMDSSAFQNISKPIQQSKVTEMFATLMANPMLQAELDATKAVDRYLTINDENPRDWMKGDGRSVQTWQMLADLENKVMMSGTPLEATDGATMEHTMEHFHFLSSALAMTLNKSHLALIHQHAMAEDKNNPMTNGGPGKALPPAPPPGPPGAPGQQGPPGAPAPLGGQDAIQSPVAPGNSQSTAFQTPASGPMTVQPADIGASNVGNS